MQVVWAWFFVEERESDRAEDTESELQLLMTVRSGKDEAALFDKLLFERNRYPRGTAVLEMWPTFLNGKAAHITVFHSSIVWKTGIEASQTLSYQVSLK